MITGDKPRHQDPDIFRLVIPSDAQTSGSNCRPDRNYRRDLILAVRMYALRGADSVGTPGVQIHSTI